MSEEQTAEGTRVRSVRFSFSDIQDSNLVPEGTEGTVKYIDGAGGIHVEWDNGATIALLPGYDFWEVVTK